MKEYILAKHNANNIEEFRFSVNDKETPGKLQWENEKEFSYNGLMYDVVDIKKENEEIVIHCIKDKKENQLVNDYARLSKDAQGDPVSKNKSTVLIKLITNVFVENSSFEIPFFSSYKHTHFPYFTDAVSKGINEILIPPPQQI